MQTLEITPNKLKQYLECGLKFSYHSADRTVYPAKGREVFERMLRQALSSLHAEPVRWFDEPQALLRSVWDDRAFGNLWDSRMYFARGLEAIKRYCMEFISGGNTDGETLSCNEALTHTFYQGNLRVRFSCTVDRLAMADDGVLEIIHYVTGNDFPSNDRLASYLPGFIAYALVRQTYSEPQRIRTRYVHVEAALSAAVELSWDVVESNKAVLWQSLETMASGKFPARTNSTCSYCPCRTLCTAVNRKSAFVAVA